MSNLPHLISSLKVYIVEELSGQGQGWTVREEMVLHTLVRYLVLALFSYLVLVPSKLSR